MEKLSLVVSKKVEPIISRGIEPQLTLPHIRLLIIVKNSDSSKATDIASYFGVTLSAVTGMLDRVEEFGLLERVRSAKDRRIVEVRLTDKGMGVYEKIKQNLINLFNSCFQGISKEEIDIYFRVNDKIISRILSDKE
jgi:DNA-binding MarR family transcriptional regulator